MKRASFLTFSLLLTLICSCSGTGSPQSTAGISELSDIEGTTNVTVTNSFQYTFSQSVNAATITTTTFYIVPTNTTSLNLPFKASFNSSVCNVSNALPASVSYVAALGSGPLKFRLAPTSSLSNSTSYTVCLTTGISYTDGTQFAGASYQFTTAAAGDDGGGTEGGDVTISGTLAVASASISPPLKNIQASTVGSNYIAHILNNETGGQKTANVAADGTFSFTAGAGNSYTVNFMNSDKKYVGTLATGDVSDDTVPVALTTGADGTTTDLGTITADEATGQVTSDATLNADTDHLAATSGGIIAGGATGEGTTDYSATVGQTCTAAEADCPDFDHDGVPDIFDTNNDNDENGYADEITGAVDLCVPGAVDLYIVNYTTAADVGQPGFPTPSEVSADLGATTMYNIRVDYTPDASAGYTIAGVSQIAVTTPSYIDSYGYVYNVTESHECWNTLWTDCNGKKLLLSEDGTKYEIGLADINLARAGILEYMFPGDTYILNISLTDGTEHVCTRKINIIPKYFAYAFSYNGTEIDTSETVQLWDSSFTLSWTVPSPPGPSGQTYELRFTPYQQSGDSCTWDPDVYGTVSAGQDGESAAITEAQITALAPSDVNYWTVAIYTTDSAGDTSYTSGVNFTTQESDPCTP